MKQGSSRFRSDLWRWLPGVVVSLVALVGLSQIASWEELIAAFSQIKFSHILAGTGLTVASLLTRSIAWRILLKKKVSISQTFFGINVGYLLNNLFPLRAGELGRAIIIARKSGLSSFEVLSTIVIERTFDLILSASLLLATLPLALELDWAKPITLATMLLALAGLAFLYWIARNTVRVNQWMDGLNPRWEFGRRMIIPRLRSLLNGFSIMTDLRQFALSIFWIILTWAMWVLLFYVVLLSIAPDAPIWWAAFTDGVLAMGIALPSAPGALGILEAAIVGALGILGIDPSTALAYAITMRVMQFSITGIFGSIGLIKDGNSITRIFSEIKVQKTAE